MHRESNNSTDGASRGVAWNSPRHDRSLSFGPAPTGNKVGAMMQRAAPSLGECTEARAQGGLHPRAWGPPSRAIQRQTDTTPPGAAAQDELEPGLSLLEPVSSQEGDDSGQGVASIEAGLPFLEADDESQNGAVQAMGRADTGAVARPEAMLGALDSPSSLPAAQQLTMERHFGHSFRNVKIHTNPRANALAASLGAQAFTYGSDIAFAAGRFRPGTSDGEWLIAHELTHVVQQRQGLAGDTVRRGIGRVGDRYEREADRAADAFVYRRHQPGSAVKAGHSSIRAQTPVPASPALARAIQAYSGSAAAAYATSWANSTNTKYGRFSNDCTNFVSQAVEAGGWKMEIGSSYCGARKDNEVWWFKKDGCDRIWPIPNVHASHSWGGAENFYQFTRASGRGTKAAQVAELGVGDILQADWDSDGNISHTMIVTKSTPKNTYLTYHTSDHLNEPFWPDGKNRGILGRNPNKARGGKATYYGWKL